MSDQYGAGSGYAPMPGEPPRGPLAQRVAPPPVLTAVRMMFVQAALGVLGLIVLFATKDTLKTEIAKRNRDFDAQKLDDAVNAAVVIGIVVGIVITVLYILLALQVRKGKNWARIVTWVLAGLGIVSGFGSLAQPEPALSRVITLLGVVVDVAIVVFLAQRPSSAYFRSPA
jgi:hypothetical protein